MGESGEKQTLVSLTQGFIKILTGANGGEVELAVIEKTLNTQKRRLYDVINVLAGVGLVERTGKSRVKWISQSTQSAVNNLDVSEKELELDQLIARVDADLQDITSSELFQRFGWIDQEDAYLCEPDESVSLLSLKGPPSMSIAIRNDEYEADAKSILCRIEKPSEGPMQMRSIRTIS
jgi:transcription factor E2F3